MVFLLSSFLVISALAKRLAGKSISDMTYIVSSGTLNVNSINLSRFILCSSFFVFDDLYFVDFVFICLVLCKLGCLYCFAFFPALI